MKYNYCFCMTGLSIFLGSMASARELAKVNDTVITDRDLEMTLSTVNEGMRSNILKDSNSRRQILLGIIDKEVLVQEAEKQKIAEEPGFQDQLNLLKKQLLMSRLLERKVATQLTEASEKKYYKEHLDRFSTDRVHVQQILAADETQAKKFLTMAQEPNADFQSIAEKFSKDPSAKNNRGDLGFIGRGRFVREFTDAVFSAPIGEIVGPIKTDYGYHLVKVIDKRMGKPLEFEDVQFQVRSALREELMRNYVDNLKAQSKIKVDQVALEK